GRYLEHALPEKAVILSVIQSGSVRLYGKHMTMRWDEVPAASLDRTIGTLTARGYVPYILLEDWEEPMFRQRFASDQLAGLIDWSPRIVCYGPVIVRVYDPADREKYLSGERWVPRVVPHM